MWRDKLLNTPHRDYRGDPWLGVRIRLPAARSISWKPTCKRCAKTGTLMADMGAAHLGACTGTDSAQRSDAG